MSAKNRDAVKNLPCSEPVKAYIACNLELERALEYLMPRLEKAGVADKTCIVLTNDHYPYGLTEAEYNELVGQTLDTFGGKATARLGEFVDVLYRIAGRPETDNATLPSGYENEEFNAAHPLL